MPYLRAARNLLLAGLLVAMCTTLFIAVSNLIGWIRETDMMFGHYKGPPELILDAMFWSSWAVGLALTGGIIYLASHRWRSKSGESTPQASDRSSVLLGLAVWLAGAIFGGCVWGLAAPERQWASLQLQRDSVAELSPEDPDAAARITEGLRSDDWLTRQNAAESMTRLEGQSISQAVPDLIEALESPDSLVAFRAAEALGKLHTPDDAVINALIEALDSQDAAVRVTAAQALAKFGPTALTKLDKLFNTSDPEVRRRRMSALRQFPDLPPSLLEQLRPLLKDKDVGLRTEAVRLWRKFSPRHYSRDSIEALIFELEINPTRPNSTVIRRLQSAGWRAYEATPQLEPLLDSSDPKTRLMGARAIWEITGRSQPILDVTTELLQADEAGQQAAIMAIGSLGPLAETQLEHLESLRQNANPSIASLATRAIPRIKREARTSEDEIKSLLSSKPINQIERGLYEVERRGDLAADLIPEVQRLIQHQHQGVQQRALGALVRMGPKSTVAAAEIQELVEHPNQNVRQVASQVLDAMNLFYATEQSTP